jgi:hypothetical protein
MATLSEQASKLLDFNQKLDITLLDNIVGCMYAGIGEQVCSSANMFILPFLTFHLTKHSVMLFV